MDGGGLEIFSDSRQGQQQLVRDIRQEVRDIRQEERDIRQEERHNRHKRHKERGQRLVLFIINLKLRLQRKN